MGRQWNTIIESLGPLTGGSMSISANLTDIEALLTTLQADVADGIIVSSGTVNSSITNGTITTGTLAQVTGGTLNSNLRDGSGNLLTSGSRGSERALSVQIVDASGNQITSFGTANVSITNGTINSNIRDGSGNSITSTSISGKQRLDVTLAGGGTIGSASPTFADLVAGTDGTNLRAFSTDTAGRVNVNPVNQSLTTGTGTASGTSAVGTDLIASTDVSGFAEASVQFTGIWPTGATVTPQVSNDNSTWVATTAQSLTGITTLNATGFTATNLGLNRVVFAGARYFRLRVTGAGSAGTYDFAYTLNPRTTSLNGQGVNVLNTPTVTSSVQAVTNQGHSTHHTATSAASTNATNVKASNTNIGSLIISNTSSSIKYLKLFNLTVAPTMGTSSPVLNYAIMPNSTMAIDCGFAGIRFPVGLSYAITSGQALLDNTAVGAGDVVVNIAYV